MLLSILNGPEHQTGAATNSIAAFTSTIIIKDSCPLFFLVLRGILEIPACMNFGRY